MIECQLIEDGYFSVARVKDAAFHLSVLIQYCIVYCMVQCRPLKLPCQSTLPCLKWLQDMCFLILDTAQEVNCAQTQKQKHW